LAASVADQLQRWLTACREIPMSGPLGMMLGSNWENPAIIPFKSVRSCDGSGPI